MKIGKRALALERREKLKTFLKSCFQVFDRNYWMLEVQKDWVLLVDAAARRPCHPVCSDLQVERDWILWLLSYLNPLECNSEQALVEWRAQFQLYFSNTVPGYRVLPHRKVERPDIREFLASIVSTTPKHLMFSPA